MFITAEFVLINPKLNEIYNNIKNTQLEYNQKYGYNYYAKVDGKFNVKFFDKIENKTKNFMIEHENIIGKVNQKMQSSIGMNEFIRALKLIIKIQGKIHKNIVNVHLKCDGIPIIWKKHYSKVVHDRFHKHNLHCLESHFHDFTKCNGCFWLYKFFLYK